MSPAAADLRAMRRILLALDASLPSRKSLEEAARLARRLDAELTALFVEDINLLNLAELPFARHTNLLSGAVERIDMARMESMLRVQAAQARSAIEAVALDAGLRWSFRIVRGRIAEQVIAAAADQDLLLIGWTTRGAEQTRFSSLRVRKRPMTARASTVRAIAGGSRLPVLLLRNGDILSRPVAVVFDGSEGSKRAIEAAAALAAIARQKLVVLIAGAKSLVGQATALLEGSQLSNVDYHVLPVATVPSVCEARAQSGSGIVVLDADSPLLANDGGNPLAAFSCPVLLAR